MFKIIFGILIGCTTVLAILFFREHPDQFKAIVDKIKGLVKR